MKSSSRIDGFRFNVIPGDPDYSDQFKETPTERLITLRKLAQAIGVPLFAVRRGAKKGDFPVYRIGNGRVRVRLTEVLAAIDKARETNK
jgi:hypothetical protein